MTTTVKQYTYDFKDAQASPDKSSALATMLLDNLVRSNKEAHDPDEERDGMRLVNVNLQRDEDFAPLHGADQSAGNPGAAMAYEVRAFLTVVLTYAKFSGGGRKKQEQQRDPDNRKDDPERGGKAPQPDGPHHAATQDVEEQDQEAGTEAEFELADVTEMASDGGELLYEMQQQDMSFNELMPLVMAMPHVASQITAIFAAQLMQPQNVAFHRQSLGFLEQQMDNPHLLPHDQQLAFAAHQALSDPQFMQYFFREMALSLQQQPLSLQTPFASSTATQAPAFSDAMFAGMPQMQQEFPAGFSTGMTTADMQAATAALAMAMQMPATENIAGAMPGIAIGALTPEMLLQELDTGLMTVDAPQQFDLPPPGVDVPEQLTEEQDRGDGPELSDTMFVGPTGMFQTNMADVVVAPPAPAPAMEVSEWHYSGLSEARQHAHANNPFYMGSGAVMSAPRPNFNDPAFGGSGIPGSADIANSATSGDSGFGGSN